MAKGRGDYDGLISRRFAVATCVFGMIELLAAIIIVICSFVLFGGFCEQLDCEGISKGLGLWLGFPLMIPSLLAVVVLGTRHSKAMLAFGFSNVATLILSIVHTVLVYNEDKDYWKQRVDAFDNNKCRTDTNQPTKCLCTIDNTNKLLPFSCDLINFGSDVNWTLFGFSIAGMIISFICVVIALIGYNLIPPKPRKH